MAEEDQMLTRRILLLRYGTETPAIDQGAFFSMNVVAKYIGEPLKKVKSLIRKYQYRKK